MNKNFKSNERELVKVATFFKRQSKRLIDEGKLGSEHSKVADAVDNFIAQMEEHANTRAAILAQRDALSKIVKDSPVCPKCNTSDKLKIVGTEKNDKGWRSNRYRCRKCNIEFTWNRPNNPWDMVQYIEEVMRTLEARRDDPQVSELEKEQISQGLLNMQDNLDKFRPVIESHDQEYEAIQAKDQEMERLIHEFKNSLLIERIKMDTWENKQDSEKK